LGDNKSRTSHRCQEVPDDRDRFLPEPRSLLFVAVVSEEGSVCVWTVVVRRLESLREQLWRVANLRIVTGRDLPATRDLPARERPVLPS
jgi:hypothetical protein